LLYPLSYGGHLLILAGRRLPDSLTWGYPGEIVDGIACRRRGRQVVLSDDQRHDRAVLVRRILKREIERLLA
jgi:hypothetical protein